MAEGDLYQAASDLRDACVALLADTAPATCYVRNAAPIFDEEDQLIVYVPRFGAWQATGQTDRSAPLLQQIGSPNQVSFIVTITRCADGLRPSSQEAVAQKCYADVWILWNGLRRLIEEKALFTGGVDTGPEPMLLPTAVVNEQGNVTGWALGVQITLDGYDPRG